MRVVVVGAGVMGLSTARVLAERGHDVVALDRFAVANTSASSSGPTRIWRLAHGERRMVRLALRTTSAWHDLERRTGRTLLKQVGLLWRGDDAVDVHRACVAEGVVADLVDHDRQAQLFPELRPDRARAAVWQPEAGVVLAADALDAQVELLARAGGALSVGERVLDVVPRSTGGVTVTSERATYEADVAVVTTGPWASELLERLGVDLALRPLLEQVSYVNGPPGWEERPCVIDDFTRHGGQAFYAMPTPGVGYKVGIDTPLRPWRSDDLDRSPSPERAVLTQSLVEHHLSGFGPSLLRSEVCSWTASPDESFVLDRVGDVVIGCGDSGQGFKFLPVLGEILADLATDVSLDADSGSFSLARFR
ncbi:MAG: FAD-dependent oxidoreductase [Actinomycetes bacterium]